MIGGTCSSAISCNSDRSALMTSEACRFASLIPSVMCSLILRERVSRILQFVFERNACVPHSTYFARSEANAAFASFSCAINPFIVARALSSAVRILFALSLSDHSLADLHAITSPSNREISTCISSLRALDSDWHACNSDRSALMASGARSFTSLNL